MRRLGRVLSDWDIGESTPRIAEIGTVPSPLMPIRHHLNELRASVKKFANFIPENSETVDRDVGQAGSVCEVVLMRETRRTQTRQWTS